MAIKGIVRPSCVRKINRFFFLFEMESWKLKAINLIQFGVLRPVSSYVSWSGIPAAFIG